MSEKTIAENIINFLLESSEKSWKESVGSVLMAASDYIFMSFIGMNYMKIITRTVVILSVVSLFTEIASEMLYPVLPMYLTSIGLSVALTMAGFIRKSLVAIYYGIS
jgi:hypothetical protein